MASIDVKPDTYTEILRRKLARRAGGERASYDDIVREALDL